MPNILTLDIETSPNLAYVWSFFKENISAKQVLEHTVLLCWSAKWLGEDEMLYSDGRKGYNDHPLPRHEKRALKDLLPLLEKADMVVGHNISGFDMRKIRGRCLVHRLPLPAPYKEVDTYKIAKKEFGFTSNSLEYLAKVLGLDEQKSSHKIYPGFELWTACMQGEPDAWAEMERYCKQDVVTTEAAYLVMRPYATQHPNVAVYEEAGDHMCPKCGSHKQQRRGYSFTNVGKYQRYQCQDCGGWSRTRFSEYSEDCKPTLLTHAVS